MVFLAMGNWGFRDGFARDSLLQRRVVQTIGSSAVALQVDGAPAGSLLIQHAN